MQMVVMLARIVEEAGILAVGLLDDLFERKVLETGFGSQFVAVVNVSLVVLVMMIFERFARHKGCERIVIIRQCGQFESHGSLLFDIICAENAFR